MPTPTNDLLPASRPAAPAKVPTFATYNIRCCVGRDGLVAPDRIAAVIRELDADVVALQEVEAQHRFGALDQWVYLAETLGYFCTPGISLRTQRRNYGNALLTREPVQTVRLHDLSVDRREPRGAIDVDLMLGGAQVRVVSTHLGLRGPERRRQIDSLLALMELGAGRVPTIMLGDINEWRPGSSNLRALGRWFKPASAPLSFPARLPLLALDRIMAAGIGEIRAHRSPLARIASDHLPVRALVTF